MNFIIFLQSQMKRLDIDHEGENDGEPKCMFHLSKKVADAVY